MREPDQQRLILLAQLLKLVARLQTPHNRPQSNQAP
jgi:hypothetical protein